MRRRPLKRFPIQFAIAMSAKSNYTGMTEAVRCVLRKQACQLSAPQIAAILGGDATADAVRAALTGLAHQGEVRPLGDGAYEPTQKLRPSASSVIAMIEGSLLLQRIAIEWGNARPNDRRDCHAQTD